MKFTTNYKNNSNELLPAGQYEMIIDKVKHDANKNNKEYLSFTMIVRNDLDQALPNTNGKAHNRYYTYFMYASKDTGEFSQKKLQYIMEAAGIPEGTEINSFDDFTEKLMHRPVRLNIKIEYNDYYGEDRNNVAPWDWKKTKFPQVQHVFKKKQQSQPDVGAGITDNDLPF